VKKYTVSQLIPLLAVPVMMVLLGLVLLFSPDTASALVGKLIAWLCILAGLALGAGVFFAVPPRRNDRIIWAVICLAAGVWLLCNPLTIAKFLGRVLGCALMILGARPVVENIRYHGGKPVISRQLMISIAVPIAGAVLMILPMIASRLVFKLVGILLICIGVVQGLDKLQGRKQLDAGQDPHIIDVEKL